MKTIDQASVQGKKVLIRVDFNVPLDSEGNVSDDKRIRESLPTIRYVLDHAGAVILMSHLGRPKGGPEAKYSLSQITSTLENLLERSVNFVGDCVGEQAYMATASARPGEVILLENLRFYKEEEKGDAEFSMKLAKHGDIYVNDAFGTAHRAHASTAVIAHFMKEKYAGFLMKAEVENAEKVLTHAKKPYVAIMGGAKVSDKILIIERLLDKVDYLLIGGGMAYTFLKSKGHQIGKSLVEDDKLMIAATILKTAAEKGVKIILPVDSVVSDVFGEQGNTAIVRNTDIPADMMGLDIGPDSYKAFHDVIMSAKTILWNGPMGVFEMEKFASGTVAVARAIADATDSGAYSLIGGGDSAAAVKHAGVEGRVSYVSTGGGALLEYLEGKTLPGVAALDV